jgi:hypothetical protein
LVRKIRPFNLKNKQYQGNFARNFLDTAYFLN